MWLVSPGKVQRNGGIERVCWNQQRLEGRTSTSLHMRGYLAHPHPSISLVGLTRLWLVYWRTSWVCIVRFRNPGLVCLHWRFMVRHPGLSCLPPVRSMPHPTGVLVAFAGEASAVSEFDRSHVGRSTRSRCRVRCNAARWRSERSEGKSSRVRAGAAGHDV